MNMSKTELMWRERTSALEYIASVWTCKVAEITSRTVLADPCISIIHVKGTDSSEVRVRGPETKSRRELLVPGYIWTAIRLQPGVLLQDFSTQAYLDDSLLLPTRGDAQFQFGQTWLQFPDFHHAESLVHQMHSLGYIRGQAVDSQAIPRQGISAKSYSRFIKHTTGLSPYKLHQLRRIHEALHFIQQGMPPARVAVELGFVDQAHLNRATKQFLGHTPTELLGLPQKP